MHPFVPSSLSQNSSWSSSYCKPLKEKDFSVFRPSFPTMNLSLGQKKMTVWGSKIFSFEGFHMDSHMISAEMSRFHPSTRSGHQNDVFFSGFSGTLGWIFAIFPRFFLANHPFSQVTACIEKNMNGCLDVGCFGFIQGNVSGKCLCMSHLPLAFIDSCQARSCKRRHACCLVAVDPVFLGKKNVFPPKKPCFKFDLPFTGPCL